MLIHASLAMTGYHALTNSWHKALMTLFGEPHNQTVNIVTHMFGALVTAGLLGLLWHSLTFQKTMTASVPAHIPYHFPSWPFVVFYGAATICLGLSTTFHVGMCHSKRIYQSFNSLDYVGIVILITGSYWPMVFFGFFCQPRVWIRYNAVVGLFAGMAIYLVSSPRYRDTEHRLLRTTIFLCLGFSGMVPLTHNALAYRLAHTWNAFAFDWFLRSAAFYVLGAVVYVLDFPERWSPPGRFDILGHSHQIMHLCVLAAIWAQCEFYASVPPAGGRPTG